MLDACAVADVILSDYQVGDAIGAAECSEDVLVEDDVVILESVPGEVEEGERAMRVVQYEQWKEIDGAETWCDVEASKERAREWTGRRHTDSLRAHRWGRVGDDRMSLFCQDLYHIVSTLCDQRKKRLYSHPFTDNSIVSTFEIIRIIRTSSAGRRKPPGLTG